MTAATDATTLRPACSVCGGAVHELEYPDAVHDGRCSGCGWFTTRPRPDLARERAAVVAAEIDSGRGELVSRAQRFGAQALLDEVAEILVVRQEAEREKLERLFAGFVADEASVAPFSEILRHRLRGRAFEELIADVVHLVHELELDLPQAFSRLHGIDTVASPKGLHMRRAARGR